MAKFPPAMTITDLVFILGVSALMAHELDAVDKREWRLLFVLRRMSDDRAHKWFVSLHVPLFVGAFVLVAASESAIVTAVQASIDGFLVVHLGLHERLQASGRAGFGSRFSRAFIWAGALFGVLHIGLLLVG